MLISISAAANTQPDAGHSRTALTGFYPAGLPAVGADGRHPEPENTTMTKLSDTQRVILSAAAQHEIGLATAPKTLPAAARNAVFRSLIKNNLLTEINAPLEHVGLGWRQDGGDTWIVARITDEGLRAIGIDPNEGDAAAEAAPIMHDASAAEAEQVGPRVSLRDSASALLVAWDACPAQDTINNPISRAVEVLQAATQASRPRPARESGAPRQSTKQEAVLTLLRRPEGITITQVMKATGWQQHTVRGFFVGLKKRQGITVTVLERIRQVGPGAQGSRGSHSIFAVVA